MSSAEEAGDQNMVLNLFVSVSVASKLLKTLFSDKIQGSIDAVCTARFFIGSNGLHVLCELYASSYFWNRIQHYRSLPEAPASLSIPEDSF